jgi:nucleotide-binding universal stress UspA family protein
MPVFGNILFPVDFSDRCAQVARYVAGIARKFNSKVTLLHAIGIYDGFRGADLEGFAYAEWQGWMRGVSETQLAEFGKPCLDPFVIGRVVEEGEAAGVICDYAEDKAIDVIVMPTHGRGVFRRLLLGSVTSKVLHDTAIPVWTLAHVEQAANGFSNGSGEVRKIVCAVDSVPESVRIIKAASEIAGTYGASIYLVHALPPPPAGPESYTMDTTLDAFLRDSAEGELNELQKQAGTAWEIRFGTGSVASVVKQTAADEAADLVIIGRGHIHGTFGRLRSNASAIIRESPCPVLSF